MCCYILLFPLFFLLLLQNQRTAQEGVKILLLKGFTVLCTQ